MFYSDSNLDKIVENQLKLNYNSVVYLGFRPENSFELHEAYANNESYPFKILKFVKDKWLKYRKYQEDENDTLKQKIKKKIIRPFDGMNPDIFCDLIFDSKFESGNLDCIIQTSDTEFDLYMRVDTNTQGHLQWFNFRIKNKGKSENIKINICNFTKENSLYLKVFFL